MNQNASPFATVYFIVWAALAIGMTILYRVRRDAGFRIRWHARICLITSLIIFVFMFMLYPSWASVLFIGVFGGLITYLNITKTTICKSCGKIIQGIGLIHRAKHCPHCGGETVCSKIFT
jgi:hypothetical protein